MTRFEVYQEIEIAKLRAQIRQLEGTLRCERAYSSKLREEIDLLKEQCGFYHDLDNDCQPNEQDT